ncbi:MAG: hypothetical protein NTV51_10990, partial [Verrucomicrobia bacterium]|nr:hypothetical protein [Verrucomicrobiota bacterium]
MTDDPNIKGTALERAVEAIEAMVIRAHPGLSEAPFTIQPRANVRCGEQTYKVDVYVKIHEGMIYEKRHIFECKNWKDPVPLEVIPLFVRKMVAIGATGTIVGRKFTEDAKREAKLTPGLDLVHFDDDIWAPINDVSGIGFS